MKTKVFKTRLSKRDTYSKYEPCRGENLNVSLTINCMWLIRKKQAKTLFTGRKWTM